MRNQPLSALYENRRSARRSDSGRRLAGLFTLFLIPIAAIAARVWYLQAVAADFFRVQHESVQVVFETIPAQHGRILSADGLALAYDQTRFEIAVHYRWLEDPPNPGWLREQARRRLAPRERRDSEKLAAAEQAVRREHASFWAALEQQTSLTAAQSQAQRQRIQLRIERMKVSVEERRKERAEALADDRDETPASIGSWRDAWRLVVRELTTAPARESPDPLILKEELDFHTFLSDVPLPAAVAIQSAVATFPPQAIQVRNTSARVYPAGDFAAHLVGARRTVEPDRSVPAAIQSLHERRGISGIEQSYDSQLRGREGLKRVLYNSRREIVSSEILRAPVNGQDVTLTLDSTLQSAAERILDEALTAPAAEQFIDESAPESEAPLIPQGGVLIAMDIHSGEIIAAAAAPRFDLSLFSSFDEQRWQEFMNDPRRPFFSRTTALTAPPGSVFKVLTSVAALESGVVDGETPIHCQGYLNRPDQLRCMIFRRHGAHHGDITLAGALCQSCNVYFFEAARRMPNGEFQKWIERFGFGAPTGADIPGEAAGAVPRLSSPSGRPSRSSTLQVAIGQSSLLVSPLQVVRMMAAVANGGGLVQPRFVRPTVESSPSRSGIQLAKSETLTAPVIRRIPEVSPRTLAIIREGLALVVEDARGTGKSARVRGVRVAGKTGTAETGGGRPDHAWFTGYVPADRPRIAFVVMLEHAGSGGQAAGPLAKQFIETLIESGRIRATK